MITIVNPEKYRAGLYERLSNEKIEVGNGEVVLSKTDELESGSISTQKLFNENFCKEHKIGVFSHYTDDGVSGATFDRPDFNRMISDIENRKINMVIVKDLSRFGRLSSKISYYLEEYFIEKKVRFIAVTDDIDTGNNESSEEMTQFKAFFNEWFLRDTSKKIRNGKRTRAIDGKVMTTYPAYGYMKDPLDKNHYVVDPDTAPIIRRIFMMSKDGKTPTQIGLQLTREKVLVPSEICGNNHTRKNGIKRGWNRNTVKRILQNVVYLGYVSNGNIRKINYKSNKIITMPKEERIIVEGMHTPIIDKETFDIVQEMIRARTYVRTKSYDWLLKGLLTCKECGKKLSIVPRIKRDKKLFYLRCNTYACNTHLNLCTPHSNNLEKVTNEVISKIKQKCKEFMNYENANNANIWSVASRPGKQIASPTKASININLKQKADVGAATCRPGSKQLPQQSRQENRDETLQLQDREKQMVLNLKNELKILEKKKKDTDKIIEKLYEDKCSGILAEEDFTRIYTKQTQIRREASERILTLKRQLDNEDITVDINKLLKTILEQTEPKKENLVTLVDRIEVSEDKKINIIYKFNILN